MHFSEEKIHLKAIFTSLMEALELSDPHTGGHSERVGALAVALGMEMGLTMRELEILKDASVLHDIGKIGVSKDLLNKTAPLTSEEFEHIKQHVHYGFNIIKPLGIRELSEITLLHHERIDGKGYPDGRKDYPLLVRVLQISDVWDALSSDRPYRKAMTYSETRDLMNSGDNRFGFDTEILEQFLRLTRFTFPDDDCDPNEMDRVMAEIESLDLSSQLTELPEVDDGPFKLPFVLNTDPCSQPTV